MDRPRFLPMSPMSPLGPPDRYAVEVPVWSCGCGYSFLGDDLEQLGGPPSPSGALKFGCPGCGEACKVPASYAADRFYMDAERYARAFPGSAPLRTIPLWDPEQQQARAEEITRVRLQTMEDGFRAGVQMTGGAELAEAAAAEGVTAETVLRTIAKGAAAGVAISALLAMLMLRLLWWGWFP